MKNISLIKDVGLMNGKTGISIYLFHLSKTIGENIYREHAETLIDDVFQVVEDNNPSTDFRGHGISLVLNKFQI